MSGVRVDTFIFKRTGFIIEAERSAIYADGSILSSDRNGLYGQVLKGLLVYYALSNDFPKVKKVKITRRRNNPYSDVIYTEGDSFQQPVLPNKPRSLVFSASHISELLEETDKGNALRIAMTYWLKAANSSDPYFKFDRLWKAFDRLLLYEGNTVKQIIGIPAIKTKIIANERLFTRSKAWVNNYTDPLVSLKKC